MSKIKIVAAMGMAITAEALFADKIEIKMEPGECWWGGAVVQGEKMPFTEKTSIKGDMLRFNYGNPGMPIFMSNHGRYLRCTQGYAYMIENGIITAQSRSEKFETGKVAKDLPGVYRWCRDKFFPPAGKTPDLALIATPQYNTWIELQYNQNEKDILGYAEAVKKNGFPAGVMMIDDTWQLDYGTWEFDPRRFTNPKAMCDKLHADGFKLMLWVVPFVSGDSPAYRELRKDGGLFMCENYIRYNDYPFYVKPGTEKDPAIFKWWNGKSAQVDLSHPNGIKWFHGQLDRLVNEFGVDGFKLDAGDLCYFDGSNTYRTPNGIISYDQKGTAESRAYDYSSVGLRYPLNEYRTVWGHAGEPVVVRLADKEHKWSEVERLIPHMAAAGLAGYQFVCPDMIGGGQYVSFLPGSNFEPEIFVRSAQVHALSPMMQFSAAPWRVLDAKHLAAVKKVVDERMKLTPYILDVARECAKSGEPMLRTMEYCYPNQGYTMVNDQFLIGDKLLVAPQMAKGATSREVKLPAGKWRSDEGKIITGPCVITESTPLDRLPHYVKD